MTRSVRLKRDHIIFVLIDLQPTLLQRISNARSIVSANRVLMYTALTLGSPVLATCQYRQKLGNITEEVASLLSDHIFDKTAFSCLSSSDFQERLRESGKEWVVLSGIETHICVLQTCLDLREHGYHVAVITDAVGAGSDEDHQRGLQRMEKAGVLLVTMEMLIYELLKSSDSEEFRKLLPKIKELRK